MADIKEVVWHPEFGEGMFPFCPYCDEFAYEDDKCVFCGKPYKWVDGPIKETVVTEGDYTIYQGSTNHIYLFKNGKFTAHMNCTEKLTEEELKEIIGRYNNEKVFLSKKLYRDEKTGRYISKEVHNVC